MNKQARLKLIKQELEHIREVLILELGEVVLLINKLEVIILDKNK